MIARALNLPDDRVRGSFAKELNDKVSFLVVALLTTTQKGREYKFKDETERITLTKEATVSINAYGRGSLAALEQLNAIFYTSWALNELKKIKMGLVAVSSIRNLSLIVSGGVEERGQIDVTISYIERIDKAQNQINTAEILTKESR
ncbi:LIC_12616 family protein [Campylobacter sp.]|uniref:phage neck terminator protein n=1 Tax=Campylobacter sp. TaxID=205 RepID=UPI00292F810A|nr:hypothetical protein [Campylobacter sp.]